jgi:hypothetical protein
MSKMYLYLVLAYVLGIVVALILDGTLFDFFKGLGKKKTKTPAEEEKAKLEIDRRFQGTFYVYSEDVEDFLVWVIKNHAKYGRFLTIDEFSRDDEGRRELLVSCFSNNEALVEAEKAASYPFAMVGSLSDDSDDLAVLRRNIDLLPKEDKGHVALVKPHGRFSVYLCVDHERPDLLDKLDTDSIFRSDSETIQKGDHDDIEDIQL